MRVAQYDTGGIIKVMKKVIKIILFVLVVIVLVCTAVLIIDQKEVVAPTAPIAKNSEIQAITQSASQPSSLISSIVFVEPKPNAILVVGKNARLIWKTPQHMVDQFVSVELSYPGSWAPNDARPIIAENVSLNAGSVSFVVPDITRKTGVELVVATIYGANGVSAITQSEPFFISTQPIIIEAPSPASKLVQGQTYKLQWIGGGKTISIMLFDESSNDIRVPAKKVWSVSNIPNTGVYDFIVPDNLNGYFYFRIVDDEGNYGSSGVLVIPPR